MKLFANDAPWWAVLATSKIATPDQANNSATPLMAVGNQMKHCGFLALSFGLFLCAPFCLFASDNDGVALAIVYDTSGSMREPVMDTNNQRTAKYVIANRALISVAQKIEQFRTNQAPPRKIEAGVFVFRGEGARAAVPFGPFNESAVEAWASGFSKPIGSTPLGNAVKTASDAVFASPLVHKHILVITDGVNTAGPAPATVLSSLKRRAEQQGTSIAIHFLAFDVDAKVFDDVKKKGATVLGAADERQLETQLNFILQKKILLEDEEPPKKP